MEMCKVCRDFFEEENVKIKNGCCDNCNDFNIQEKKDNKTNVNIKETNKNNEEFNIWYYILSIALITVFINLFKQNKIEVEYIFYFVGIIIFMSFIYMVKKWLTIILILFAPLHKLINLFMAMVGLDNQPFLSFLPTPIQPCESLAVFIRCTYTPLK